MNKKQPKQAFTLIELLTVIAIIGILASILIPTVGRVREAARRTVDASNIRQIGQASLIYANDNNERLPPSGVGNARGLDQHGMQEDGQTGDLHSIAAALARSGGLNDASIWVSTSDPQPNADPNGLTIVLDQVAGGDKQVNEDFKQADLSFAYIAGLSTSQSSNQPIAITRGLHTNGKWTDQQNIGVYGDDGGHIVFLGGNVSFYKDVGISKEDGIFIDTDGERTNAILDTVDNTKLFFATPNSPTGSPAGRPGTGG